MTILPSADQQLQATEKEFYTQLITGIVIMLDKGLSE